MKANKALNGPIPGENYLANTKNMPWHRPPDMADFVEIVDTAIKKMSKPQQIGQMRVMLENGETILDYITGMLRMAVGSGKIPIDMAVLAAGPMARYAELIAKKGGYKYKRGWEQEEPIMTTARANIMMGKKSKRVEVEQEFNFPSNGAEEVDTGFMPSPDAPASKDEQMAMLGQA